MIPVSAEPLRGTGGPAFRAMLLHVSPSFGMGGVPLRTCRIINHFGQKFRHTIISLDGNFEAARHIPPDFDVNLLPPVRRRSALHDVLFALTTLRRLRPDLLVTYNWGSMDWAIANRLLPVAPQLHFEDGFGKEEANGQLRRRVLCRHWALARCKSVVVPSHLLERSACDIWRLPNKIITYLPNGVNVERFSAPVSDALPGLTHCPGELIVGTLAPLRPEKNVGRLLRVFARIEKTLPLRLVIAGDGAERNALGQAAHQLGIADRVVFTGHVSPESVLGHLDIFAMSSDTEQMPVALLEAMAARLPVASVDVGDIKAMVCPENQRFIVARDDEAAFAAAIERLLHESATRERLGRQNRERVVAEFSEQRMFERYSELFLGCLDPRRRDGGHSPLCSTA